MNYSVDIDNQAAGNYSYDKIGNLTKDNAENITGIHWTVYGKIKHITKTGTSASQIAYGYDAGGNRTLKSVDAGGVVSKTFYVRDAQGNVGEVGGAALVWQQPAGFVAMERCSACQSAGGCRRWTAYL
jgi:hypothetical protein